MTPSRSAELTASPRLAAFSFLNKFLRCVSTDETARPRSFAMRFVVCPFATALRICISREVNGIGCGVDRGVDCATRLSMSGIILRGTGLSLRSAASNALFNSAGPTSLRTYPEQPACIIRTRSSLDSDTVQAMILRSGYFAINALAVVGPSISGICTSISTMSGFSESTDLSASAPDAASPTRLRSGAELSMARAAVRGTMLSSTTSTRCLV